MSNFTRVTSGQVAGATVTLPSHQASDLFIAWAVSDGAFSPSTPAGWTSLGTGGFTSNNARACIMWCTSGAMSNPTFTGADAVYYVQYRNVIAIGAFVVGEDITASNFDYPALTFDFPASYTQVCWGWLNGVDASSAPPVGANLQSSNAYGTKYAGIGDSNGAVSSFPAFDTGLSRGDINSPYFAVELIAWPGDGWLHVESAAITTVGGSGAGSINVSIPATVDAGNLLLMFVTNDAAAKNFGSTPTDWTKLSSTTTLGAVYGKVADGTEGGTTVNVSVASGTPEWYAVSYVISNWSGSLSDVAIVENRKASSTTIAHDSLSPSWGSDKVAWFIAGAFDETGTDVALSTTPGWAYAGYRDGGTNSLSAYTAVRYQEVGTLDPANITLSSARANIGWTVAVKSVFRDSFFWSFL